MTTYYALHQFNRAGLDVFEKVFDGRLADSELAPLDPKLVSPVEGTTTIKVRAYTTAKEMAQSVSASLGEVNLHDLIPNTGMWAWLTFILRDELFKRDADGTLIAGQTRRWFPARPNDALNANRHLVRMPVILLRSFGDDADPMLCGPPHEVPKIRYELTRQQGMFNATFQKAVRALYFDDVSGRLKLGASGMSGGTVYRLAQVYKQLDVTWEIEDLEHDAFMRILPAEFDRFKPEGTV